MNDPSKLLYALTHLNRAPTKFGKAPHKPVLFITLLELIESGLYILSKLTLCYHRVSSSTAVKTCFTWPGMIFSLSPTPRIRLQY